jgi:hypothetical protein
MMTTPVETCSSAINTRKTVKSVCKCDSSNDTNVKRHKQHTGMLHYRTENGRLLNGATAALVIL